MKTRPAIRQYWFTHCFALALALGLVSQVLAQPMEVLYETRDGARDNYPPQSSAGALVGCLFKVGATNVPVTHLGYYDAGGDGLAMDHHVGIFSADSSTLLAWVLVTNGVDMVLTNGYRWVALSAPYLLRADTSYVLAAEVFNLSGDAWPDFAYPTNWNAMYVGTNGPTTRDARYGSEPWPFGPVVGSGFTWGANGAFGAAGMATWPVGPAKAGMADTTVSIGAGQTLMVRGVANGAAPLTLEWYKVPGTTPLAGQTNATLIISNAAVADSGDYYLVARNALGTSQSPNCTVTVSAIPVSIATNPTNTTVYQNYGATFYVGAVGTPPITYQWSRNGSPIAGATQSAYTLAAAALTNQGDTFSCVVSNNTPAPTTASSATVSLTVLPNAAQPASYLHETPTGQRNNHSGMVGARFTTGDRGTLVSHLGFFDLNNDGLMVDHHVGLFSGDGVTLLGEVLVPAGTGALLQDGYRYVALDSPLVLASQTQYILAAEVFANDGDPWPNSKVLANWNPLFVGTNASAAVSTWGASAWPAAPMNATGDAGSSYGAPNLALLPLGKPAVTVTPSAPTQYETLNQTFEVIAGGQPPVTVQWYKSPGTLLPGETNSILALPNLALGDAGNYYVTATNGAGSSQSANATLTVLPAAIQILQDLQPLTAYIHQTVRLSVVAQGLPPLSYEWKYNGNTIPNATNATLVLADVSAATAGSYQVIVTNPRGSISSAAASLTVLPPPAGSYMSAVMEGQPLVYYRFSDIGTGSNTFNYGTLGMAHNGVCEGAYAGVAGPQPPTFPVFEADNSSIALDGTSTDVRIPALNLNTGSGPNFTVAAWIKKTGPQQDYAGIVFCRQTGAASGLSVKWNGQGGDILAYHWNNLYWDFNSGLAVPDSQWVFVALVIEPSQATFYLHDGSALQTSTNVAPHAPVAFSAPSYVGWDSQAPLQRRFYGQIDEPMMFHRALSASEVYALYHAALVAPVRLEITRSGSNLILTWANGTLQQADEAGGPYSDLTGVTSPHSYTPSPVKKFFRVKVQ